MQKYIEKIIFGSKWLLVPFYFGLLIVMMLYTYVYVIEIGHLIMEAGLLNKEAILLSALEMVDIVMIANLVKMIITGSYTSFVNKHHGDEGEKVSSGMLKVKMSTSLAGVSSVHMLQVFVKLNSQDVPWSLLYKQLLIHGAFLVGAIVLSVIDYLHIKSASFEKDH